MITIDLKQYEDITKRVWRVVVDKLIQRWIRKSILFFERELKIETPVDTWKLRNTYKQEYGKNFWKVLNYSKYWYDLHEWTPPHKVPISVIEWWAKRHGVSPYAVAKSIAKNGTKARLWITKTLEKYQGEPQKIFDEEVQNLLSKL